jgi:cell division septal protein FtsQ
MLCHPLTPKRSEVNKKKENSIFFSSMEKKMKENPAGIFVCLFVLCVLCLFVGLYLVVVGSMACMYHKSVNSIWLHFQKQMPHFMDLLDEGMAMF